MRSAANTIMTITWLTFHEAWRRWMMLIALVLGLLFLMVFAIGSYLIAQNVGQDMSTFMRNFSANVLLIAGLYVTHFLTVMLAIFASVDTLAGEISSHTIQALITKPVRRWQVLMGKWLGYAAMISLYLGLLVSGIFAVVYLTLGYYPSNALTGIGLLVLEALVLLSLSLLGGTRLSTLTNGVALFMLYGLSFIGAWVEQIGALMQSHAAVNIGIITSLLMPVEALWRRAAYQLQPAMMRSIPSPFSGNSAPSGAMVLYAMVYALLALLLAIRSFSRRDL